VEDAHDALAEWIAFSAQGLVAQGVYRNKETEHLLSLDDLQGYRGKRARKGRLLTLKIKQPRLRAQRHIAGVDACVSRS